MQRYCILFIGLFFLVLVSCNDKSSLLTTYDDSSPNLAAESPEQVILRTRIGDGPMIERQVTPVRWDAKSELLSGVVYTWNSYEEALAAYRTRSPEKYKILKDLAESRMLSNVGDKVKPANQTALAYSPTVQANVWRVGGYDNGTLFANCSIDQPAPSSPAYVTFFLAIDQMVWPGGPIINLETFDEIYPYTQQPHYCELGTIARRCPAILGAFARLYVSTESPYQWIAWGDDACGWH